MGKLYYHGTHVESGLEMAIDGFILSPFEKSLKYLQKRSLEQIQFFKENYRIRFGENYSLEEIALFLSKTGYNEREIEHRVKCLSLTEQFLTALHYAIQHDTLQGGGLVLSVESSEDLMEKSPIKSDGLVIYVPGKLSLKNLKEVHISKTAQKLRKRIETAFEKYKPNYFNI